MSAKRCRKRFAISRQNRTIIVLLCLLIALIVGWLDRTNARPPHAPQTKTVSKVKPGDIEKYQGKTFTVVYTVDGDTIDINIPDDQYDHTRIRLWGIDTPETKAPNQPVGYFGPEASEFTKQMTRGKRVKIYISEKQTRDKYDRLLAYVQFEDGSFLNELLLSDGFAYADRRFKHQYYNKYLQLESAARRDKNGLWANVKREQFPEWLQRIEPDLLKNE